MYGGITLLNNESLYERFKKAQEPQRMELLFEMARRVGTSGAMLLDEYRENMKFRGSVDEDTERLFRQYKLNGGQNDTW
ncbi:MAG: hypothetical protein IKE76_05000 [Clostridia bacterium]|nr:hypothetical protein [Clostridia bacterium]